MAKVVMLVEDEPLVVRMYEQSLANDGFEVVTAGNGKEALEKIQQDKPDLVLMDIMMPGMNGIETLERIKSDKALKSIKVVILTNLSGRNDAKLALSKGASECLVKNELDPKELGSKLKAILGG